jgi:cytochrome c oxidase subunit IV
LSFGAWEFEMTEHGHGHADDHEHHSHGALYFSIFAALCVFTVISFVADKANFLLPHNVIVCIVMAVAVCKALCVMMIFMHLKFERAWKYLLLAPTFVLAFTIPFALAPDIGWHYYTSTAPQIYEHERIEAEKAADAASTTDGNVCHN